MPAARRRRRQHKHQDMRRVKIRTTNINLLRSLREKRESFSCCNFCKLLQCNGLDNQDC